MQQKQHTMNDRMEAHKSGCEKTDNLLCQEPKFLFVWISNIFDLAKANFNIKTMM